MTKTCVVPCDGTGDASIYLQEEDATMAEHRKLTDKDWKLVFQLRCRSKQGGELSSQERALVDRAYKEDEDRYGDMEVDVFNATVPFGSNVRRRRD